MRRWPTIEVIGDDGIRRSHIVGPSIDKLEDEQKIGTSLYFQPQEVAEDEWWRFVARHRIVVTELPITHVEHVLMFPGDLKLTKKTTVEGRGRKVRQ